jgi:hypothetical protein
MDLVLDIEWLLFEALDRLRIVPANGFHGPAHHGIN